MTTRKFFAYITTRNLAALLMCLSQTTTKIFLNVLRLKGGSFSKAKQQHTVAASLQRPLPAGSTSGAYPRARYDRGINGTQETILQMRLEFDFHGYIH